MRDFTWLHVFTDNFAALALIRFELRTTHVQNRDKNSVE